MEAAVAYFEATGKRKLLDVLCRYPNHIDQVFGPDEGQKWGYPTNRCDLPWRCASPVGAGMQG
jgi:DUF1680 family protein